MYLQGWWSRARVDPADQISEGMIVCWKTSDQGRRIGYSAREGVHKGENMGDAGKGRKERIWRGRSGEQEMIKEGGRRGGLRNGGEK